jgi:hypothetical protein
MHNPPIEAPPAESPGAEKTRKRSGYLTAYLIFLIVCAVIAIFLYSAYLVKANFIMSVQNLPVLPLWSVLALLLAGILELVCSIAVFNWKKWGFWVFCLTAAFLCIVYVLLHLVSFSFGGLVGVVILFVMLNIGDEDHKAWPQMD